jgi:hypothetical protein
MTIKIDKNIPIPTAPTEAAAYPFDLLEIDDSFAVPIEKTHSVRTRMHFEHRKNSGKRFVTRTIDGRDCRVWRIK